MNLDDEDVELNEDYTNIHTTDLGYDFERHQSIDEYRYCDSPTRKGLNGVDKLRSMVNIAKWEYYDCIVYSGPISNECMDLLRSFNGLHRLAVDCDEFPLEEIVTLPNLTKLIVKGIQLSAAPNPPLSIQCYAKLQTLQMLRILNPFDVPTFSRFLCCNMCYMPQISLVGAVGQEDLDRIGRFASSLETLIIDSTEPFHLNWLDGPNRICGELVLKSPLVVPSESNEFQDQQQQVLGNKWIHTIRLIASGEQPYLKFLLVYHNLFRLLIQKAPWLTDRHLQPLLIANWLTWLNLSGTPVLKDELLQMLLLENVRLKGFIAVRHPTADASEGFTDHGMRIYVTWDSNDQLRYLEISGHQNVTEENFNRRVVSLPKLSFLGVRKTGCKNTNWVHGIVRQREDLLERGQTKFVSGWSWTRRIDRLPALTVTVSGLESHATKHNLSFVNINLQFYSEDLQKNALYQPFFADLV
jgi:hypothetical protein